jgi:Arc/MetJ-type ribon-helix-helix transcriptional regulator
MRTQLNVRVPDTTKRQIDELLDRGYESQAHVIIIAVNNLYREETKMNIHEDLQSVLRRIPAEMPFAPYSGDTVIVIKNKDGAISVVDNGDEVVYTSIADATEAIDELRDTEMDLSTVEEYT